MLYYRALHLLRDVECEVQTFLQFLSLFFALIWIYCKSGCLEIALLH